MQQRASIARALAFDADILLMDEPFGALDEIVRDRLNEELLGLWARTGKTIAFVTHSIPEAVFLSTRIVVMSPRPGRVTDVIESPLPRRAAAAHPREPGVPRDRRAGAGRAPGGDRGRGVRSRPVRVRWAGDRWRLAKTLIREELDDQASLGVMALGTGSAPVAPSRPGPEPGQRPTAPWAAASRPPAVAPLPSSRAGAGFRRVSNGTIAGTVV